MEDGGKLHLGLCSVCLGLKAAEVSSLPSSIISDAKEITNHIAKQILVCTGKT